MVLLPATSRERGRKAEAAFRKWLDRTRLGYMIVDQTPFSVPIGPEYLKRPDYLIGIMSIGMIAVDVKGRDLVDGCGIIEVSEYEGFSLFERYFGTPVWYVWYPHTSHTECLMFRNADLSLAHKRLLKNRTVYAVPLHVMHAFKPFEDGFDYALFVASRNAH